MTKGVIKMKVTKTVIKEFENEQKQFGTKVAITNVIWLIASELLKDIGVKKVSTTYKNGSSDPERNL